MSALASGSSIGRELAESQLDEANISLQAAADDLRAGRYSRAVFNSQQCLELAMKAALTMHGIIQLLEHDVMPYFASEVVTRASNEWVEPFREIIRETSWLFEHYTLSRYPTVRGRRIWRPSREYTRQQAEEAIDSAKKAFQTITRYLKEKFKLMLLHEERQESGVV